MPNSSDIPRDYEREVAAFVAELNVANIPESVRSEAKTLTADTLGAIIAGAVLPEPSLLAADQARKYPGSVTMHGTRYTSTVSHASLVNGVSGSVLELNAGHKHAAGHPVIYLFPALLAEAEATDAAGTDFLSALVAGYEVSTRTARACEPLREEYLPHGVWGGVGAAAAVARVRNFGVKKTLTAMQLAASFAQHTSFEATIEGATGVRNGSCGFSNLSGMTAADLSENGFIAVEDGIRVHLDRTSSSGFDSSILTDRLGEFWEIERGYYKIHAAGRLVHPAIDGAAALQNSNRFDVADIDSITVETYEKASKWADAQAPENRLQAKSSVSFGVATRLVHGESGKDAFEPEAITEEVLVLMERITVSVDPNFDARVPEARSARVTIQLDDGRTMVEEIEHAKGGNNRPYTRSELREKFQSLTEPVIGADQAVKLWNTVQNLPDTDPTDFSTLGRVNQ